MRAQDAERFMDRVIDDGFHQAVLNWSWVDIDDAEFQQRLNDYHDATDALLDYVKKNIPQ